jgi:hypothetical protein
MGGASVRVLAVSGRRVYEFSKAVPDGAGELGPHGLDLFAQVRRHR